MLCIGSHAQRAVPATYDAGIHVNYVRTWVAKVPDTNVAHFTVESPVELATMSTSFLDGLGRPIQSVIKKGSLVTDHFNPASTMNGHDLVQATEYDAFGRESFKYLPFVANDAGSNASVRDGLFKVNPFEQQAAFYDNSNSASPIKGQGETYFYGQTIFEASPLNRTLAAYAVGNSWVGSSKGTSVQYLINTVADSVRIWNASDTVSNAPSSSSTYAAGELYKTVTTDVNSKQLVEYKDKDGHVVLKKVQMASTPGTGHIGWLCTYYIYNDLGDLRFVLQPKAVEALLYAGNWTISNTNRDELCFYYGYDYRNRMVVKKMPGGGEVYMVFDEKDRLAMVQDANMRNSSKWLVTLYDTLGRPTQTGLVDNSSIGSKSFTTHQNDANTSMAYPFSTGSIPGSGYEELTRTGYDNYDELPGSAPAGSLATTYITSTNFLTTYNALPEYAQQIAQSAQTRGMTLWTKIKVLGTTSTFLYSTSIFDRMGRAIQVKITNISGGVDTMTTQYDFAGKVLRTHMAHSKAGTNPHQYYILTKNSYDGLGKAIAVTKRSNIDNTSNTTDRTISKMYYDALGALQQKNLGIDSLSGNPLDSLVYDYNIRGWALGMNRDYAKSTSSTGHYFGFDLGYDQTSILPTGGSSIGSFASAQYTGNITGVVWKSAGDQQLRKYDFTYDVVNRLTGADFNQYTLGTFNKTAGVDFSVSNLAYDPNGNILSLTQKGWKVSGSVIIDSLAYHYTTNTNKLLNVVDASNDPTTVLGDFRSSTIYMAALGTKTSSATDYTYDDNGNLVKDLNKDMVTSAGADGIEYNFLNLPRKITVKASSGNKGTIEYTYDVKGNKLKKVTTEGSTVTTTLYMVGNYINDTLQFLGHEEGRMRPSGGSNLFNYDYFIKDHLGNVRMVLTEEQKSDAYPVASLEVADSSTQNLYYANLAATRTALPSGYPYDTYTNPNDKVAKVNGSGNKIGPAIVLKVMAGDKFNIRVSDWFKLNGVTPSTPSPITNLATVLATSFGGVVGVKASAADIGTSGVLSSGVSSFLGSQTYTSSKPKAFVNWILFDEQFNYVSAACGYEQVGADNMLNVHTLTGLPVTKNGYLYIYVSNETPNIDVFFDNLEVTHIRGSILEETHYYPFGLTMAGISTNAVAFGSPRNKKKFNDATEFENREFSDESGLDLYATDFRSYDPQIGRFNQLDILSDEAYNWSPYSFAYDNPIAFNDPLGLFAADSLPKVAPNPVTNPSAPRGSIENPIPTDIVVIVGTTTGGNNFSTSDPILRWNPTIVTVNSGAKKSSGSSGAGSGVVAGILVLPRLNPTGIIVTSGIVAAYTAYLLFTRPLSSANPHHYFQSPDNTFLYRPSVIFVLTMAALNGSSLPPYPSDPTKPPGEDWEWRGRPGSVPGGEKGAWYNEKTKESLCPDFSDGHGHGEHYDYKAPDGTEYRWYPDGTLEPKK
jgi:RHS repeat-associated protein